MQTVMERIVGFLINESRRANPILAFDLQSLADDFAQGKVRIDAIEKRILAPPARLHPLALPAREAFARRWQAFLHELAKADATPRSESRSPSRCE